MNKDIERIKLKALPILKKYGINKAGIFGSYATGKNKKNSDIDSAKAGILSTVTGYLPGGGIGEGALAMLLMILKMYYTGKNKDSELEQASTENDNVKETHIRTVKEFMERVAAGEALTAQTIKDVAAQKQATATGLAAEIRNKVKES